MAKLARAEVFDPAEIFPVHLIGKTVRSCYSMGVHEHSGKRRVRRRRTAAPPPTGRRPEWLLRFATITYHPWWLGSSSECRPG